jgi:hypothetical protein
MIDLHEGARRKAQGAGELSTYGLSLNGSRSERDDLCVLSGEKTLQKDFIISYTIKK